MRQLITRTRRRFGPAPGGGQWAEHAGGGTYLLHPAARLDWAEFCEFAGHGTGSGCSACLRHALGLVRGEPFGGCGCWWLSPAVPEAARADIVTVALNLSGLELADDPAASARTARTGLRADPASEPLWQALMRAEYASGSLAGVHEAWARCLEEVALIAPGGQPHLGTTALYHQLTGLGGSLLRNRRTG